MIETRYYLDRKNLTYRIVYIEPKKEYGYEIEHSGMGLASVRRLIYYEINANTGERTGRYYRVSDLFRSEKECNTELKKEIKEKIKNCRKEIYRLNKLL